jgi:hypothetical protein
MAFLGAFAEASGRVGQVTEGFVAIDQALARSERTEARWGVAELLRLKGDLICWNAHPTLRRWRKLCFSKASVGRATRVPSPGNCALRQASRNYGVMAAGPKTRTNSSRRSTIGLQRASALPI